MSILNVTVKKLKIIGYQFSIDSQFIIRHLDIYIWNKHCNYCYILFILHNIHMSIGSDINVCGLANVLLSCIPFLAKSQFCKFKWNLGFLGGCMYMVGQPPTQASEGI